MDVQSNASNRFAWSVLVAGLVALGLFTGLAYLIPVYGYLLLLSLIAVGAVVVVILLMALASKLGAAVADWQGPPEPSTESDDALVLGLTESPSIDALSLPPEAKKVS